MRYFICFALIATFALVTPAHPGPVVKTAPPADEKDGASGADGSPAPWPTDDWPRSTPGEQALDPRLISPLVEQIRAGEKYPGVHSLLVVRNGYLVVEEYFDGYGPGDLHMLQSVTKSVTSALIGIAIDQNMIRGVDERVVSFFPRFQDAEWMERRKKEMTIRDLLTMRTGSTFHERPYDGSPLDRMNRLATGWIEFVLEQPMERAPGERFRYDSGGVILLAGILREATKQSADQFARHHLFEPLGIENWRWSGSDDGVPHAGGGLSLRPRDMARIGLLYLRGGRWQGRQVISRAWVEESTRRQVRLVPQERETGIGYGYLWWVPPLVQGDLESGDMFAAMGWRGQYIFGLPQHDMVVVITGGARNYEEESGYIDLLYSHLLKAAETAGIDPESAG
jgi:CubicO group peptidase (beta-lactamase class C family)